MIGKGIGSRSSKIGNGIGNPMASAANRMANTAIRDGVPVSRLACAVRSRPWPPPRRLV